MLTRKSAPLLLLAAAVGFGVKIAAQGSGTYDLKDPKGVSGLQIALDSPLEPIYGQSSAISGTLNFDAEHPEKSTGKVVVATDSVTLAGAGISHAAQQDWCLNPAKFPTIEFDIKKIDNVKKSGDTILADVTGNFTLHGVTKPLTAKAKVTPLVGKLKTRGGLEGKVGDLVKVQAKFTIDRIAYGVGTNLPPDLVAKDIKVDLSIIGTSIKN